MFGRIGVELVGGSCGCDLLVYDQSQSPTSTILFQVISTSSPPPASTDSLLLQKDIIENKNVQFDQFIKE